MKFALGRGACALLLAALLPSAALCQQMSVGMTDTPKTYNVTATIDPLTGQFVAPPAKPLAYTNVAGSPFTLTSSWVKVATTTAATKGLLIAPIPSAATFDIEWTSVTAGASAPTDLYGAPVGYGETFPGGLPVGDIYAKSATGMIAIVRVGG